MHPAWGAYPDTILRFPDAGLAIDLRRPVSPHAKAVLSGLGPGRPFGVVTACNPRGGLLEDRANRRLIAVLDALVLERYRGAWRADGCSPDGAHVEPGWAVPAPLPEVALLAARFFQNGLFWYEADRFSIVPVLAPYPPLPLPDGAGS